MVVSQGLHPEVLGEGAAAVREHAGGLLLLLPGPAALELDPVRHGGQELLGQRQHPLVLSGLGLATAWRIIFSLSTDLLADWGYKTNLCSLRESDVPHHHC